MKIILISGKAQSGKDTTATMIKNKLEADNHKVLLTHYADLLKYICCTYFNWNGKKDENGRELLQYVGTDVIRKQNPSFWVDFISMILKYFPSQWDYVIVPDCRFPNEISRLVEAGFEVIHVRVTRSNFISPLTAGQQIHPSETALDDIIPDFHIKNDGTLDDLEDIVMNWIKEELYN